MNLSIKKLNTILPHLEIFKDGDWVESKDQDQNGKIRLIQLADIGDGYFVNKSKRFINEKTFKKLKCTEVKKGDILIARMPEPLGRACVFEGLSQKTITVVDVCILRVKDNYLNKYWLTHAINSKATRNQIKSLSKGATRLRISRKNFGEIKFKIPSLKEQNRIAKLLLSTDRIIELRKQSIIKLEKLIESIFVDMFNKCKEFLPLKDIIIKKKIKQKFTNQKIWSLTLENINSNTGELLKKEMISPQNLGTSTFYFEPNVVLYSKLRPYLNKVFFTEEEGYATSELVPLYCDEKKINPIYLLNLLRSKKFVEFANTNSRGAKMPRVIMDKFWNYKVPLPSLSSQRKFMNTFKFIEKKKNDYLNANSKSKELLFSLRNEFFNIS